MITIQFATNSTTLPISEHLILFLLPEETDVFGDSTLIKNVMGTALGMLMFRESLRGTCGETVYRCWRDIEAWRHIEDCVRRMYWKNVIKNKYIRQDSNSTLRSRVKVLVFQGKVTGIF